MEKHEKYLKQASIWTGVEYFYHYFSIPFLVYDDKKAEFVFYDAN